MLPSVIAFTSQILDNYILLHRSKQLHRHTDIQSWHLYSLIRKYLPRERTVRSRI